MKMRDSDGNERFVLGKAMFSTANVRLPKSVLRTIAEAERELIRRARKSA